MSYFGLVSIANLLRSLKTIYFGININNVKNIKKLCLVLFSLIASVVNALYVKTWVEVIRLSFCVNW